MRPSRLAVALTLLALLAAMTAADRLWLALDATPPAWDEAQHLSNALTYRDILLRGVEPLSAEWRHELLTATTRDPPAAYLAGAAAMLGVGAGPDAAAWVFPAFSALLLVSVFAIGARLWGREAGFWAAAACALTPGLRDLRLTYLIDLQMVALTTAGLACLTVWATARGPRGAWAAALGFGAALGSALLVKAAAIVVLGPAWAAAVALRWRHGRTAALAQGLAAGAVAAALAGPWYAANLLFVASSAVPAVLRSAVREGDPGADSLAGWLHYPATLPAELGWPLLALAAAGVWLLRREGRRGLAWVGLFALGVYVLMTLIPNKDARYVAPSLPAFALLAGAGAARAPRAVAAGAMALAAAACLGGMFGAPGPLPAQVAAVLAPGSAQPPDRAGGWPHAALLAAVRAGAPHTVETVGVISATAAVNEHTLGYFGRLDAPRVYAREPSRRPERLAVQLSGLDWVAVDAADPRLREGAWAAAVEALRAGPEFALAGRWPTPGAGALELHRRVAPRPEAAPVAAPELRIVALRVPDSAPPGAVVPVEIVLEGPPESLARTLLLIDWAAEDDPTAGWRHDFAPAESALRPGPEAAAGLRLTARRAMRAGDRPRIYRPRALRLDLDTGRAAPIPLPDVTLRLAPEAPAPPAAEPDPAARFPDWAAMLRAGPERFDRLFREVADANLPRPLQAHVAHAGAAAAWRSARDPADLGLVWQRALAAVLRRDADAALAALDRLVVAEPDPGLALACRAFVRLYRFEPAEALADVARARKAGLELRELAYLEAGALAMSGRPLAAWRAAGGAR